MNTAPNAANPAMEKPSNGKDFAVAPESSAPPFIESAQNNINMLIDVPLQVTVELGRTRMSVRQVLDLQKGSVIELDRLAGEAVDIYINDHLFARGEVVVVDDKFGVRITELSKNKER